MRYLHDIIVQGLGNDDDGVRKKYEWMKKYYNDAADACHNPDWLERISASEGHDVAEAFRAVKNIETKCLRSKMRNWFLKYFKKSL